MSKLVLLWFPREGQVTREKNNARVYSQPFYISKQCLCPDCKFAFYIVTLCVFVSGMKI